MNNDDFESKLQRQQLRRVPAEWREEILDAARAASTPHPAARIPQRSWLSTLNHQLSTFLWPSPKAWGALAAVWFVIFAVNFSLRDRPRIAAQRTNAASPEIRVALEQQKRLLADLIEWPQLPDAERPRLFPPRPHSERRGEMEAV